MSHDYPHLRSLVFDRPLAITPGKLQDILHVLGPKFQLRDVPVAAQSEGGGIPLEDMEVEAKLAILPVRGTLVNRAGGLDAMSGLMSYDMLRTLLQMALADASVNGIILDVDSFGGEAAGMEDLANDIREADQEKPVYAVVNAHALSAGYGLACSARRIIATQDSLVGSVGVIAVHRDDSQHNEQEGFNYTVFKAGERKDAFSPLKPLDDKAVSWINARIEESYSRFVAQVARNRGLSEEAVRDTEAAFYSAADAVEVGLVDDIMPAESAINTILSEVTSMTRERENGPESRADQPGNGGPAADGGKPTTTQASAETEQPTTDKAQPDAPAPKAGVEVSADVQAQIDKAVANARAEERQAVQANAKAIREACETMHRPELAAQFIEQGLSVEDARAKLFEVEKAESDKTAVDTNHDGAAPGANEVEATAQSLLKHKTGA